MHSKKKIFGAPLNLGKRTLRPLELSRSMAIGQRRFHPCWWATPVVNMATSELALCKRPHFLSRKMPLLWLVPRRTTSCSVSIGLNPASRSTVPGLLGCCKGSENRKIWYTRWHATENWYAKDKSVTQRSHHVSRSSSARVEKTRNNKTSAPSWVIALFGPIDSLQRGQVEFFKPTHLSKQSLWNIWSHLSTLISSPNSPILQRHTAQSTSSS